MVGISRIVALKLQKKMNLASCCRVSLYLDATHPPRKIAKQLRSGGSKPK